MMMKDGPSVKGKDLTTPRIDVTSNHCLRYHYHGRGPISRGFSVSVHELQSGWKYQTINDDDVSSAIE